MMKGRILSSTDLIHTRKFVNSPESREGIIAVLSDLAC